MSIRRGWFGRAELVFRVARANRRRDSTTLIDLTSEILITRATTQLRGDNGARLIDRNCTIVREGRYVKHGRRTLFPADNVDLFGNSFNETSAIRLANASAGDATITRRRSDI